MKSSYIQIHDWGSYLIKNARLSSASSDFLVFASHLQPHSSSSSFLWLLALSNPVGFFFFLLPDIITLCSAPAIWFMNIRGTAKVRSFGDQIRERRDWTHPEEWWRVRMLYGCAVMGKMNNMDYFDWDWHPDEDTRLFIHSFTCPNSTFNIIWKNNQKKISMKVINLQIEIKATIWNISLERLTLAVFWYFQ